MCQAIGGVKGRCLLNHCHLKGLEMHGKFIRTTWLAKLCNRAMRYLKGSARNFLPRALVFCLLGCASVAQAVIPASQRAALTDMYISTNGASWVNKTNWNGAVGTECTWFGIACDAAQNNVVSVTLDYNNLAGPFPVISGLTALQTIDVFSNKLTGSLPSLSGMMSLTSFRTGGNLLTGPIPSLSGVPKLQAFLACCNQLTGPLPAAPSTLLPGRSNLCSNSGLTSSGVPTIDAAWDTAAISGKWQVCPVSFGSPVCTLTASPSAITAGRSSNLTASCSPAATAYSWTGGSCTAWLARSVRSRQTQQLPTPSPAATPADLATLLALPSPLSHRYFR